MPLGKQMLVFAIAIVCNATSLQGSKATKPFNLSSKQQLPANRCTSLAKPSIAMASLRPELLHERLFKMKRAWSDTAVETRHC
ncbi:hypothetical protein BBK36DRAFT_1161424 [Trichoderma citrinoviride]|uniref:Secreted protein n=1 Tax=Trichoderma citrinoviride TaxID=58853 RepID=A0A2T4B4Z2_9HYPO|nr:hypothetical protein BBK36DRAFT_1161424 [Trichoderma citrinoviride]PTB64370.1 hypothetical protein BBK36DRAFT_1161424 [Trichoderma citrinoviride]